MNFVEVAPLSPEDGGGYLATIPSLPGCMSDGETPEEAISNVFDAAHCWLHQAQVMANWLRERSRA